MDVSYLDFDLRARSVMQEAEAQAKRLGHRFMHPLHLLLALANDAMPDRTSVFAQAGVSLRMLDEQIRRSLPVGESGAYGGAIQPTSDVKDVVARAIAFGQKKMIDLLSVDHLLRALLANREVTDLLSVLGIPVAEFWELVSDRIYLAVTVLQPGVYALNSRVPPGENEEQVRQAVLSALSTLAKGFSFTTVMVVGTENT